MYDMAMGVSCMTCRCRHGIYDMPMSIDLELRRLRQASQESSGDKLATDVTNRQRMRPLVTAHPLSLHPIDFRPLAVRHLSLSRVLKVWDMESEGTWTSKSIHMESEWTEGADDSLTCSQHSIKNIKVFKHDQLAHNSCETARICRALPSIYCKDKRRHMYSVCVTE